MQSAVVKPIVEYEEKIVQALLPIIAEKKSKNESLEARIKGLRKKSGQVDEKGFESLKSQIDSLESQLEEIPTIPQLWTGDVTVENLGTIMAANNECMAILSDEAGIFDIISGRYSSGIPNLDLLLKSHSGTSVRVNRGSRATDYLKHPALTMGLTPQPEVLKGLSRIPSFRGRGLLGRFLYAIPPSNLGSRTLDAESMNKKMEEAYHEIIFAILTNPFKHEPRHVLELSKDAFEVWRLYALGIEIKMDEGGPFAFMTDWAGKLPGQIARLASLIHISRNIKAVTWNNVINESDMRAAIKIGDCLSHHAMAVFDLMGADVALDGAKAILRWVKKHQHFRFTFRDCHYAHKNRFKKADDMEESVKYLIETCHIKERVSEKRAYRPSREYDVNPFIFEVQE